MTRRTTPDAGRANVAPAAPIGKPPAPSGTDPQHVAYVQDGRVAYVASYRLFQGFKNVTLDERVTLAVIHVCADKVRFAWRWRDYPPEWFGLASDVRGLLRALRERVERMPATRDGLAALAPAGANIAGGFWSEPRTGASAWPGRCFAALIEGTPLTVPRLRLRGNGGAS